MREKYKYLGKNTIVFAISSFGTKFLSLLLVPLYTNVLSTEEYGVADLIATSSTLLIYIFTINISDAVLRFALEKKNEQKEILGYGIKILSIGSLLLLLCLGVTWQSGIVVWRISYYCFVFLYFFFTALYQILTNYLRSIDKIVDVTKAGIVSSVVILLGNIIFLLWIKIGLNGYLIAQILGPAIGAIYAVACIKIPIREYFGNRCSTETAKAMRLYSIPLIFNNISLWVNAYLDKWFVTTLCGVDQNGIYAVANKIPMVLTTCYTVFSMAWNLSAIKEFDKEDADGFISETYKIYNSFIVLICSLLILVNVPLAKLLYAKDFFVAWNYSSIMLISVMFNAMTAFLGSLFSATKKTKGIAKTTLLSAIVNLLLNSILIPVIGVYGAAIATAVSYAVMWGVRYSIVKRFIKLKVTIIKDIMAYGLLIIQVMLEHLAKHCYVGQVLVLCAIVILYKDNIFKILKITKEMVFERHKG